MDKKIPVGILAATGAVGQRFVQHLVDHPWFEIAALTGSSRTVLCPGRADKKLASGRLHIMNVLINGRTVITGIEL